MKKFWTLFLLLMLGLPLGAQVANQAISFKRNGRVSLGVIAEVEGAQAVTMQWWMNPQQWIAGANVVAWGDGMNVQLGSLGALNVQVGAEQFAFQHSSLVPSNWSHVTLTVEQSELTVYVNNEMAGQQQLAQALSAESVEPLLLGGGFVGRIDEVRVWSTALPADYNRYWNNTIDKHNPSWKYLEGYWKFDQSRLVANVYDYSGNDHNGTFSENGVERKVVTDNAKFVYRRNLAYSDCSRFFDRVVQKGQYLKSNVISMIGATAQADGSLKYKQPDNPGVITGGEYIAKYGSRRGVLDLAGTGAQMNVGPEALIAYNNTAYLSTTTDYTFMTWLCVDAWNPGAYLIKKESTQNNGISLRLGAEQGDFVLRCNGVEFTYTVDLQLDKWYHIGFSTNAATLGREFVFVFGNETITPAYTHTSVASTALSGVADTDCLIGVDFDGKLDLTITWTQKFNADNIIAQGATPIEPGIGKTINGAYSRSVDGLWKYDLPDDLGRDSYSTPEWFRMIKDVFDGYEGAHVTISIDKYADEFFTKINNNAQYRQKLAKNIAAMGNEDFLDGVDYDFEWSNNWSGIGTLCQLVREKLAAGKIQAVSPHELYYSFPTDKMQYVDYFNFQDYGPGNKNIFNFTNYKNFFTKAKNYGYPVDKIMLSYATTTSGAMYSNGSRPESTHAAYYPTGWRSMPYETFTYEQNSYDVGEGLTRYFTGMKQTWQRSEYMNNNGCAGIFYWDMGNDAVNSNDDCSLATFASFAINSNVQKIVESVKTAAEVPADYEAEGQEQEQALNYYQIRGASDDHTGHYIYQNGDEVFAGDKAIEAKSIFCFEEIGEGENMYYLKANDGRYIQDRNALANTNSIYQFGKTPVSYSVKSAEYNYPEGHVCLEQTYYVPGKEGFTDVQRCLKCNENNRGVSTWGPWTAASHWTIVPVYGYSIYKVTLADGLESITYNADGYTGTRVIYSGGFIVLTDGETLHAEDITFDTTDSTVTVTIDEAKKTVYVGPYNESGITTVTADSATIEGIYDMFGRKLNAASAKGIYIINGKKHIKR